MNTDIVMGKHGEWFYIVCYNAYEFEGTNFYVGDISQHCWGRNIPDNWRKATEQDVINYRSKHSLYY